LKKLSLVKLHGYQLTITEVLCRGEETGKFSPSDGLDRFGRAADHAWTNPDAGTTLSRFAYGFDRNSNRLYREDLVAQSQSKNFDELYAYDGLDRLDDMKRGLLNSAHDAVTNVTYSTNWNLDAVGNWSHYTVSQTQGQMQQGRQHNKVNEITDIDSQPLWGTPQYDAAGNTTAFPQPSNPNLGFTAKYDAWNRLCTVKNPSIQSGATVAEYEYDARGFRIRRREYDASTGDYLRCYDDYFTDSWQLLETRVTTSVTAVATQVYEQYVWHASADAYIDQLLLRRRDTTDNGSLDETLIALQDAHYNVAALINTNGAVQERYAYSPYGERIILDASYVTRTTSSFDWRVGHQGLRHDVNTALVYNRARMLSPIVGRFVQRDPLIYVNGLSLYQYVKSMPTVLLDSSGMYAIDQWMFDEMKKNKDKKGKTKKCYDKNIYRVCKNEADQRFSDNMDLVACPVKLDPA